MRCFEIPLERHGIHDRLPIDLVRRRERRSPRRKRQTLEDLTRHARIRDGGEQSHPSATGWTAECIDLEDAFQQIGPSDPAGKRFASIGTRVDRKTGSEGSLLTISFSGRIDALLTRRDGLLHVRPCRHHLVPPARTRREHTVISDLMRPGRRDQRSEPLKQLPPLHYDMGRPISPGRLEPIGEPSVCHRLETTKSQRRTGDITAEPFEALSVSCRDGYVGVKTHTALPNAAGRSSRHGLDAGLVLLPRLDPIPEPSPRLPRLGTRRDP